MHVLADSHPRNEHLNALCVPGVACQVLLRVFKGPHKLRVGEQPRVWCGAESHASGWVTAVESIVQCT